MPGSCSSNSLNGCASCAPGLALFSVSASANFPAPTACPEYLNESYSGSKSYNGSTTYACNPPYEFGPCSYVGGYNASTSASTVTTVTESESEGLTTITTIYSFTSSTKGSTNDTCANRNPIPDSVADCTNTQSSTSITKIDSCGNSTSSYSSTYNPCLEGGFVVDWVGGCYNTDGSTCDTTTTCDRVTVKSTKGPGTTFCKSYGMGVMQSQLVKTNEKKYDKPESIVDKQISKLKTNNFGAACKCGEGEKDDCWGGFGGFTFANPTVTISKAALKIGVIKEGFDKKYKSVGGTVSFYYGGTGGKTPCCNDDFDGTVVTSMGFSLGGSDFLQGQYLATDIGQLSTGPIGQTVGACIEITSISFV
jgi:hypothetical protein